MLNRRNIYLKRLIEATMDKYHCLSKIKLYIIYMIRFKAYLLPNDNDELKDAVIDRKFYSIKHNQLLPYEVEWALSRLL